ncbi:MAG: 50S ribosomal protein L21 [Gemmataceae bacterium]|nr:50S ribosomal protein L21 [Gemmataceae bacterium]
MYAVFEDGSRQYLVSEGDVVKVDYRETEEGDQVEFNRILLYQKDGDTRIGQPAVEGARVVAEVIDHPSTKLYIQKFRRRKNSRRLRGHRQHYTRVQIQSILLPGEQPRPREEAQAPAGEPAPAQS